MEKNNLENKKLYGQYMTPQPIVEMILNKIGYSGSEILSKKIMEPSFGEGIFIKEILKRIVKESKRKHLSNKELHTILKNNVFGFEIDKAFCEPLYNELNLILDKNSYEPYDWSQNLICADTLDEYSGFVEKVDFVIGNPPYVRIHNMNNQNRETAKTFDFGSGMTDMYIIFYEMCLKMLNSTGKLGFISPNSFLKNISQQYFRDFIIENELLSVLYDFKDSKLFKDVDSYNCVCILDNNKKRNNHNVEYKEFKMYKQKKHMIISEEDLKNMKGEPWQFGDTNDIKFLKLNKNKTTKFKDIANIQNSVVTNRDKVYVFKVFSDKGLKTEYKGKNTDGNKLVYFEDYEGITRSIESEILHRCVKSTRYKGIMDNTYILFPYVKNEAENNYVPMTENMIKDSYPNAYNYLISKKEELMKRDLRENKDWFLFGRTQGLNNSVYKKIVFNHLVSKNDNKLTAFILDEDVIVYSKIYITAKKENDIEKIKQIISSTDFAKYCKLVGRDKSGGYFDITVTNIKDFGIKY